MTRVVPDGSPRAAANLARRAFRNYFRYLVEFLRFPAMSLADIDAAVEVRGVEHLHRAIAGGRGAIAIGFHIGNIDLGAAVLARVGYPVNVVVDRFEPPALDGLIRREREAKGLTLIGIDQAPRAGIKALRRGEILALLIDKPMPGEGVVVSFLGGPIAIPAGAAVLARRTGAPIVPCCVVRRAPGRFLAEVAARIDPVALATDDRERDIVVLAQAMVDVLAGWVRRYPDQWYAFRRLWLPMARVGDEPRR